MIRSTKQTAAAALLLFFTACSKEGVMQQETGILKVSVQSYWADEAEVASLSLGNTTLLDSMSKTNSPLAGTIVEKTPGKQRLQLKSLKDGSLLIDSLLDVPGHFLSMRILQLEKNTTPQLIINANEAPDPAKRNIGFSFSDPDLPETLTLELYRVVVRVPNVIVSGMDAPVLEIKGLQRGKFTGFSLLDYYDGFENARLVFKLKDEKTMEYLPNAGEVDPLRYQKGGRMFIGNAFKTFSNAIYSISRNVSGTGNITYNSNLMVSY